MAGLSDTAEPDEDMHWPNRDDQLHKHCKKVRSVLQLFNIMQDHVIEFLISGHSMDRGYHAKVPFYAVKS